MQHDLLPGLARRLPLLALLALLMGRASEVRGSKRPFARIFREKSLKISANVLPSAAPRGVKGRQSRQRMAASFMKACGDREKTKVTGEGSLPAPRAMPALSRLETREACGGTRDCAGLQSLLLFCRRHGLLALDPRLGMFMQGRIWLGVLIGSTIGGFVPGLWGAGLFSYSSVLFSGIGGFAGLWLGYRMS